MYFLQSSYSTNDFELKIQDVRNSNFIVHNLLSLCTNQTGIVSVLLDLLKQYPKVIILDYNIKSKTIFNSLLRESRPSNVDLYVNDIATLKDVMSERLTDDYYILSRIINDASTSACRLVLFRANEINFTGQPYSFFRINLINNILEAL